VDFVLAKGNLADEYEVQKSRVGRGLFYPLYPKLLERRDRINTPGHFHPNNKSRCGKTSQTSVHLPIDRNGENEICKMIVSPLLTFNDSTFSNE
jgi:hypothetical protein